MRLYRYRLLTSGPSDPMFFADCINHGCMSSPHLSPQPTSPLFLNQQEVLCRSSLIKDCSDIDSPHIRISSVSRSDNRAVWIVIDELLLTRVNRG
jgi:hypothetical protein